MDDIVAGVDSSQQLGDAAETGSADVPEVAIIDRCVPLQLRAVLLAEATD